MKKLLIPLLLSISSLSYAQYPADFSLEKLEQQYIESKLCNDNCGLFTGLKLKSADLASRTVVFEVPVSASQLTTVVLPFNANNFNWVNFSIDGKKTQSIMASQDRIIVAVPKGSHVVEVTAKLKADQLRISLAEDPKYFENNSSINAQVTQSGGNFFFEIESKKVASNEVAASHEKELEISKEIFDKPLYTIQREIYLSDKWKVRTTVSNIMPGASNKVTNISVPLLDGEKPLDSDLQIADGKVTLSLSGSAITWESSLTPKDKMVLKNTDIKNLETWVVYNENSWLYNYEGMNPIATGSDNKYKSINTWVMWPEEKVNLSFSLPKIAEGQTTNVTNFSLVNDSTTNPLEYDAKFTINTSIGGRYIVKFEDKATEALEVMIGKNKVETKIKDGILPLDLLAGENHIFVKFKSGEPSIIQKIPVIKFETPVTNASFQLDLKNRWIMFAGGADIRPAVLIWGMLLGFMLFAWFLNKNTRTPLGLVSWLLLFFGLSQTAWMTSFLIVGWILAFSFREQYLKKLEQEKLLTANKFNSIQTALGVVSFVGLVTLISVVATGLMSNPDVFTVGHGTYKSNLYWYIQSWDGVDNSPWVLSLPMNAYRVLILGWGVWLAFSLMSWLKWMWQEYSKFGYWKKVENVVEKELEENEDSEKSTDSDNSEETETK
jgi:hypothetical protein